MRIIDKLVEQWNEDKECITPIHEYIGISLSEYDDFVNFGSVRDPTLGAEWQMPESDPMLGAMAPAGNLMQPGYVLPAKRETRG